jgi:hypothetical protein
MPAVAPCEQPVATSDEINRLHNMKAKGGLSQANLDDLNPQMYLAAYRGRHGRPCDANGPCDVNGGTRRVSCKSKKGGKKVVVSVREEMSS